MSTTEDQIKKMYGGQLTAQKEQLTQDYESALSNLDKQQADAQKITDENLNRTAVEAQKAAVNNAEYYNAVGLSSGARAQARLSQENQLQENLTAIRTAQQATDAEVERTRGLLAKEYASAISKAQAENDLALAKALYEQAEKEDAELLAKQESAATLMAKAGDYTRLGALYGLSDAEIKKLQSTGSGGNPVDFSGKADNKGLDTNYVLIMQKDLGVDTDGKWGPKTRKAAYEKYGTADPLEAWNAQKSKLGSYYVDPGSNDVHKVNNEFLQAILGVDTDGKWGPKTRKAAAAQWGITDANEAWQKLRDGTLALDQSAYNNLVSYMKKQGITNAVGDLLDANTWANYKYRFGDKLDETNGYNTYGEYLSDYMRYVMDSYF